MHDFTRRNAIKLGAAALAFLMLPLFTSEEADAQDKVYEMTFQTVAPDRTPWARQLKRIKKEWEAKSGGRLKVKLFLGRGNEEALVRKCKSGELSAVGVSTAALATEVPTMGVFELPYLFESVEQADKVIDNHLFEPTAKILAKNGFYLFIYSENGYRNFATKGKVIKKPSDLATLKMRSQKNWIHVETYNALGGNPVSISVAEVLTSLSTGQVEGFDNTPLFAFATSWFNEIDTWIVSDHIYQPAVMIFNKRWFDALPKDLQEILVANRSEETAKGRAAIRALTPKLLKALEAKDINVVRLSAGEKAEFAKKTKKVHGMFRKKIKGGKALLDLIEKHK